MAKAQWGQKRICQECGAAFYDLRRSRIACPKCGTTFDPEAFSKVRRSRAAPVEKAPRAPVKEKPVKIEEVPGAAEEFEEVGEVAAEEEDEIIEDVSELGADDDVTKVVTSGDSSEGS
ncbi:MAG: TIGR02300 family protein [Alphaproteobacteria bacterium]